MEQYFPFILLALAVVLLFVLPARQRKRMQAQAQAMQESLTIGTPVMTTSGLHGTVAGLGDKTVDLEIAPGVVVTFARPAILEVRKPAVDDDGPTTAPTTAPPARPADARPTAPSEPGGPRWPTARCPRGRYFGAFVLIVAVLYGLVFFTGAARTPQLGLDLRGGTTVTLTARTPDGQAPAQEDLELARQIIEQRVNGLGVAEAEVVTEGDSNIVISVPGDDGDQARELGQTAQLRFRPVVAGPRAGRPGRRRAPTPTDGATPTDRRPPATAPTTPADAATDGRRADRRRPTPPAPPRRRTAPSTDPHRPTRTPRRSPRRRRPRPTPTLTCDGESTGAVDRPEDYVAACSEDGTRQVPARPRGRRGHRRSTDAAAGTAPAHRRVDRPAGLQLRRAARRGPSTPPPTSASTVGDHPRRPGHLRADDQPAPSPAQHRDHRQLRPGDGRPSWPTSSSTARCR